jgi:hypothetical protein
MARTSTRPSTSSTWSAALVPLTRAYGPYREGAVWAEPDVEHAARLIREVAANRAAAAARGRKAQIDVERDRNPLVTGRAVRERLDALQAGDANRP